jgi:hypothetical protein
MQKTSTPHYKSSEFFGEQQALSPRFQMKEQNSIQPPTLTLETKAKVMDTKDAQPVE